nr:right-handed parallel beta-helix repeat-containing protein [Actinomycetota bacterium]
MANSSARHRLRRKTRASVGAYGGNPNSEPASGAVISSHHRATARLSGPWVAALAVALGVGSVGLLGVVATASPAAAAGCVAAGSTGLTAAMVVSTAGTTVSGNTVSAAGCDVGIYVSANNVTISSVTVGGANDHGIFAQDVSGLTIENSTINGNGVSPNAKIAENKAIELVGVSNSTVSGNTVTSNTADGGIGVADDGPLDPGAPNPGTLMASSSDVITGNTSSGNYRGCGIVVAAYDAGSGGVSSITVSNNTVAGAVGQFTANGPVIGGIVAAADTPGTTVSGVTISGNKITEAFIPGVVVHSNAPNDKVSGVKVDNNTISGNDWGSTDGPPKPAGIIVAATPIPAPVTPVLTGTELSGNTISNEFYGVWLAGDTNTTVGSNTITTFPGGTGVFNVPMPGSGYWMAAKDGGVFNFGGSGFYGSMGGKTLNAPVVGLAPTMDQGGYWLAASDGGVFSFGDATFYGSMGGKTLNAPVVGIAPTPYDAVPPPAQPAPAGKGYWLVAKDGGVFSFGDAGFYGSMGGKILNAPVVGMATTPDGK